MDAKDARAQVLEDVGVQESKLGATTPAMRDEYALLGLIISYGDRDADGIPCMTNEDILAKAGRVGLSSVGATQMLSTLTASGRLFRREGRIYVDPGEGMRRFQQLSERMGESALDAVVEDVLKEQGPDLGKFTSNAPYPYDGPEDDEDEEDGDDSDGPSEEAGDIVIGQDDRSAYQYGKEIARVSQADKDIDSDALYRAIVDHMEEDQFWPDVWWISDHGNPNCITAEVHKAAKTPKPAAFMDVVTAMEQWASEYGFDAWDDGDTITIEGEDSAQQWAEIEDQGDGTVSISKQDATVATVPISDVQAIEDAVESALIPEEVD